jgi:hypothetical protein
VPVICNKIIYIYIYILYFFYWGIILSLGELGRREGWTHNTNNHFSKIILSFMLKR